MTSLIAPTAVQNYFLSSAETYFRNCSVFAELVSFILGMLSTQYSFNENYTSDSPKYTYRTKTEVEVLKNCGNICFHTYSSSPW